MDGLGTQVEVKRTDLLKGAVRRKMRQTQFGFLA